MESKIFKEIKKVVNTIKIFNNKFIVYMVMNEFNKLYDLKDLNDKLYNYLTKDIKLTNNDIKKNIKFINIIVKDDIKEGNVSAEEDKKRGRKKKYQTSYYERHKETIKKNNLERYYYNKSKINEENKKEENK